MIAFVRLTLIVGLFISGFSIETLRASSSRNQDGDSQEEKLTNHFVHCKDDGDMITELIVPHDTLLSLDEKKKKERQLSLCHLFDTELLLWNRRLFHLCN